MILRLLFLLFMASAHQAFACASCGSSGDDPLVLYPNDSFKMLLQESNGQGYSNIDSHGDYRSSGGTQCKWTTTASLGAAISRRSFATITKSYIENRRGNLHKQGFGDTSFAGRYSLAMLSIENEWSPQIQALFGYKHSTSQSTKSSKDPYLLDVFGNGFSEIKTGIDVWWGQWTVKPGMALSLVQPLARSINGLRYSPNLILRTTASLSYLQPFFVKWVIGTTTENRGKVKVEDGTDQPNGLTSSFFLTVESMVTEMDLARLSYSEIGTIGRNYNTYSSRNLTLAYIHSF
ncbi:MAG: hypothetical protein WCI18_10075 [Pseudomonadota bacterium]